MNINSNNFEHNSKINADRISKEIEALRNGHWKGFTQRDYRAFFSHSKEIVKLFKTLKPLKKDDREKLWDDYTRICEQTRFKRDDEKKTREAKSKSEKGICLRYIQNATHAAKGAQNRDDIQKARLAFDNARSEMKDRSHNMLRDDTQECWQNYKSGRETLNFRIKELQELSYSSAQKAVSDARNALNYNDNPYDALKGYNEAQSKTKGLYLNKDQSQWIRSEFNEIWHSITLRIEEHKREKKRKHEEWLRLKEEKERKHQEWINRQKDKISHWENTVRKIEDSISRLESQISDLEYKRSTARSDDFFSRCSDWITEKQRAVSDRESTLRELERKISDLRNKIGY